MGKKSKRQKQSERADKEFGLPLDIDVIFSDPKGLNNKAVEARQADLLKKIPQVGRFMQEGERILLVTTCLNPFPLWEFFLSSAFDMPLKNALLVFTNMRLLHIPAGRNYLWRNSIAAIRYDECNEIKLTAGGLYVKYLDGEAETFRSVSYTERAKVREILKSISMGGAQAATNIGRIHLCPRCTGALTHGVFVCPHCALKFREKTDAVIRALVIPGGGYFHTGHPVIGGIYIVIEAVIIALLLISALALEGPIRSTAFIFMGVLVFIKIQAAYQASKMTGEYIPVDKSIAPLPGTPDSEVG